MPEYRAWRNMIDRCYNPRNKRFSCYGGRGILVDERWFRFETFFHDLGTRPRGYTLDRIDNRKHYEPGNVRWASIEEQANNKRDTVKYTFRGREFTIAQWSRKIGINYHVLYWRLKSLRWSVPKALATPKRPWGKAAA